MPLSFAHGILCCASGNINDELCELVGIAGTFGHDSMLPHSAINRHPPQFQTEALPNKPLGILLCFATCSITDASSEVGAYRQHHIVNSGPASRGTHGQSGQSDERWFGVCHGRIGDRVCTRWSAVQFHFSWCCEYTK